MAFAFWDFGTKKTLTALYIGQYKAVGAFHKPVHCFKLEDGAVVHAWGSAVLNHLLYGVPFGTLLELTYEGTFKTDESRYPVKNFEIKILAPPKDFKRSKPTIKGREFKRKEPKT